MDEALDQFRENQWDAGFEGGRYIVMARLGPFIRTFQRPPEFRRRFWHSVHELAIRDWSIALAPLHLDQLCVIESELRIRYQPTLRYAREHLEFLPELNAQLENNLEVLLKDIAEEEIRGMESDFAWLEEGPGAYEKAVVDSVNEVLVIRGIRCRTRCRIEPRFAPIDVVDLAALPPWPRHRAIYQEFLRRRREAQERLLREQTEEAAGERRLLLEREATLLELAREEEQQRQARQTLELQNLQAEMAAEEALLAERLDSETRRTENRIRHEAKLRQMQAEGELKLREARLEKNRAELAVEEALREEQRKSELRQSEEQHYHEALVRQMRTEAEARAKELEQENQRNAEESRLARERESEARSHEQQLRHEARLRQLQAEADLQNKDMELDRLRAEMAKLETQLERQREFEARQREEQLRHEAQLRQLQTELQLKEKERRAPDIAELENHLNQEIGLLAMERQRLKLEEEISEVKLARTRNYIARARRRISMEESKNESDTKEGEITLTT